MAFCVINDVDELGQVQGPLGVFGSSIMITCIPQLLYEVRDEQFGLYSTEGNPSGCLQEVRPTFPIHNPRSRNKLRRRLSSCTTGRKRKRHCTYCFSVALRAATPIKQECEQVARQCASATHTAA